MHDKQHCFATSLIAAVYGRLNRPTSDLTVRRRKPPL